MRQEHNDERDDERKGDNDEALSRLVSCISREGLMNVQAGPRQLDEPRTMRMPLFFNRKPPIPNLHVQ